MKQIVSKLPLFNNHQLQSEHNSKLISGLGSPCSLKTHFLVFVIVSGTPAPFCTAAGYLHPPPVHHQRHGTILITISALVFFLVDLMREPVLQDKRQEHLKFCKYASTLIEMVSGKPQNANIDASLEKIRRVSWAV